MKIVVCVKQVPDSAARMKARDGLPDWGDAALVINPWDEYAVEAALQLQEVHEGEVIAVSIGDENASDALKHALAMGCSNAVHISDPELVQADSLAIARTLKTVIEKIAEVDLVVFGRQAIDTDMGIIPVQTARCLGWPMLSLVSKIRSCDPSQKTVEVERSIEEGRQLVSGPLPAVISVVKDIAEPRYPSFIGIRKASRADIPKWSLVDLAMEPPGKRVAWHEVFEPAQREVTTEMILGDNPVELAGKLVDKIMAEGVL